MEDGIRGTGCGGGLDAGYFGEKRSVLLRCPSGRRTGPSSGQPDEEDLVMPFNTIVTAAAFEFLHRPNLRALAKVGCSVPRQRDVSHPSSPLRTCHMDKSSLARLLTTRIWPPFGSIPGLLGCEVLDRRGGGDRGSNWVGSRSAPHKFLRGEAPLSAGFPPAISRRDEHQWLTTLP